MRKIILLYSTLTIILMIGCTKGLYNKPTDDPLTNFNSLWENVRDKYSYFKLKNIDWDKVKANNIDRIKSNMSDQQLFDVLKDMLNQLRDGHVNIITDFNVSNYLFEYKNSNFDRNFDKQVIFDLCLQQDGGKAGGIYYAYIDPTLKGKNIAGSGLGNKPSKPYVFYMFYGSFVDRVSYVKELIDAHKTDPNCKGFIFDVRDNGGGSLDNVETLMNQFAPKSADGKEVLRQYGKKQPGNEEDAFELEGETKIEVKNDNTKPIVVLINNSCFSATSFFSAVVRSFSKPEGPVVIMGQTTQGGAGVPVDYQLPNGWVYRFTGTYTLYNNNGKWEHFELGVEPDVMLTNMDETQLYTKGPGREAKDLWIEKAIDKLLSIN